MILSHKHKFIFLKTNKTAGTSLEVALSQHCGPEDIITPLDDEDEKQLEEIGYTGARNYKVRVPFQHYTPRDWARLLIKGRPRTIRLYSHARAWQLKQLLPAYAWNSYFKFCFERNPWDRAVSFYYYWKERVPSLNLDNFLKSPRLFGLKKGGINLYSIEDEIVADKVYLYEEMPEALMDLTARLSLKTSLVLPHVKTSQRKDKRHYSQILTTNQQQRIAEFFADEIRLYGYRF